MKSFSRMIIYTVTITFFGFNAHILLAQTTTSFRGAGVYGEFLDNLYNMMTENPGQKKTQLAGKERLLFVRWLRDHLHVLKAMKYWEKDVSSFIKFFLEKQTHNGMFYDYYMPQTKAELKEQGHDVGKMIFYVDENTPKGIESVHASLNGEPVS